MRAVVTRLLPALLVVALVAYSPAARAEGGDGVVPTAANTAAQVLVTIGATLLSIGAVDVATGVALVAAGGAAAQGLNLTSGVTLAGNSVEFPSGAPAGILLLLPVALAMFFLGTVTGMGGAGCIVAAIVMRRVFT